MTYLRTSIAGLLFATACGSKAPTPTTPAPIAETPVTPAPAPAPAPTPAPAPHVNPLLAASTLYEHAVPFDQIRESDYMPAFVEAMRVHDAELRAIADQTAPATFDNTIVAMERGGVMLRRVNYVFGNMEQAMTDPVMDKIQADVAPLLAKHMDDMHLDPKLFARVQALYQARKKLKLDPVDNRLLERYHLDFVRAGAQLGAADQATLRGLNEQITKLETSFEQNQLKEMNAGAVIVDDVKDLAGMSDADIATAAATATAHKLPGKWMIPLVNTTTQPALASLSNRALREKIYRASIAR
ncbi:MAG: dipeptidyl carboxypeptidase II, partial [Kofleriaceae bacterium]